MDNEEKWQAVISCNKDYDGVFYYAVKTTKIFCRPSCKAKLPLRKNTTFFHSIEEALKEGFRPCKMCQPDISDPSFLANKRLMKKVKNIIDSNYNNSFCLNNIALNIGLSNRHLWRLFKSYYSVTPNEYVKNFRIKKAKILLKDTDKDILDIAYKVGFNSISNFYKCFKNQVGTTPKEYRENTKEGD